MTKFEKIKSMNIDEFAEYLNKYWIHDNDPCIKWWNNNYCNNCEPELSEGFELGRKQEFAWCELHSKCKFFEDMNRIPSCMQTIKMWLESEVDE